MVDKTAAFIAFGSNLGDRHATLAGAYASLINDPAIEAIQPSRLYETAPVGGPDGQGRFLNTVLKVATSLSAHELLARCMAVEQEFDELDIAVKMFQNTTTRLRHCSVPVVAAPHGLTLGGGCEICLHVDKVVAHAETYMGLVEVGVGLIPGAGGVKEFVRRIITPAIKLAPESDPTPYLQRVFEQIGMAKVGTSAFEARDQGFVTQADRIVMNADELLGRAKQFVLDLAAAGFTPPAREKLYAAGRDGLAAMRVGVWMMQQGGYISKYDAFIGNKLAYAIAGGDLSSPQWVDGGHFLAMGREVFLALCREPKTMERIMFMLQNNKPLRN